MYWKKEAKVTSETLNQALFIEMDKVMFCSSLSVVCNAQVFLYNIIHEYDQFFYNICTALDRKYKL
jgi:hypothetical protein